MYLSPINPAMGRVDSAINAIIPVIKPANERFAPMLIMYPGVIGIVIPKDMELMELTRIMVINPEFQSLWGEIFSFKDTASINT